MEAENAAAAGGVRISDVQVEQERIREQRHVHAVGSEIAQIDFVHYFIIKEEIEERAQHEHKRVAVCSGSGEIRARLDNRAVAQLDIHEEWNGDGHAVYNFRDQQRVPVVLHTLKNWAR